MATTDQYNILSEQKMIPAERIFLPLERADALAEPNFVLQDQFLFPAEPLSGLQETKFDLSEYYADLLDQYGDLSEQYVDLSEDILLLTEGGGQSHAGFAGRGQAAAPGSRSEDRA